jgi:hypothetical protein
MKMNLKIMMFAVLSAVCSCLFCSGTETNLIREAQNSRADHNYGRLGTMLVPHGSGFLLTVPKDGFDGVIDLPPVKVSALSKYKLKWKVSPTLNMSILVMMDFIMEDGTANGMSLVLTRLETFSSFIDLEKEILVPAKVRELRLKLFFSKIKFIPGTAIAYMTELKLLNCGPQKKLPELKEYYGKNLLPVSDFSTFEVGEKNLKALGMMPFSQKPFQAEVVERDGRKVLQVIRRKDEYLYVPWPSKSLPLYGNSYTLRCRIRGKGMARLVFWWNREVVNSVYYLSPTFDIPEKWTEYTVRVGCDIPTTTRGVFSIAPVAEYNELEISDIAFIPDAPSEGNGDNSVVKVPKAPVRELPSATALVGGSTENLLAGGKAENGNIWTPAAEIREIDKNSNDSVFFLNKKATQVFSEPIAIDTAKKYRLSGRFKSGLTPGVTCFGLVMLDASKRAIQGSFINIVPGSETVLTEPVSKGDNTLKIKDGSQWLKRRSVRSVVAFDAKPDISDVPNRNISPMILRVKKDKEGTSCIVTLSQPLSRSYPAGTEVRQHQYGAFTYGAMSYSTIGDKWENRSMEISGLSSGGMPAANFWPGTKFVKIVVFADAARKGAELFFDDIVFKEIN